jgi:hypothetical protein
MRTSEFGGSGLVHAHFAILRALRARATAHATEAASGARIRCWRGGGAWPCASPLQLAPQRSPAWRNTCERRGARTTGNYL